MNGALNAIDCNAVVFVTDLTLRLLMLLALALALLQLPDGMCNVARKVARKRNMNKGGIVL